MFVTAWLRFELIIAVLCPILLSGCGGSASELNVVPARGIVTFDGQPVEGANVIFSPADGKQTLASQAVTDSEGRFEMSTHSGGGKFVPGIAPGRYAVAVTKLDTAAVSTTLAPPKDLLPKKYGSPQTSGLSADVTAGSENDFEFMLTSM
jgi:hypothetical protein